jgi:serine/threonine protein kinase
VSTPVLRGYEFTRLLSGGANVETWRARDPRGADVVVKCCSGAGGAVVRFASRAAATSVLEHPRIGSVLNLGQSGEQMFVAREHFRTGLTPGGDLATNLRTVVDLGRALEHAHARGLVHTAVKPSNVFLSDTNQPVLVDFALLPAAPTEFTAPELLSETAVAHARADQYSLAALFGWLVSGRVPKPGERVSHDTSLDGALATALSPDAASRHARFDRLIDAFESAIARLGATRLDAPSPVVERSGSTVHVHVLGRWTPENVATCVEHLGRALSVPGVDSIGYLLEACTGSQSAAIEALATLHRERRSTLKRVGFCSNMPQARGMAILVGCRVEGLPWKTFGSKNVMDSWLRRGSA